MAIERDFVQYGEFMPQTLVVGRRVLVGDVSAAGGNDWC
jgi:hypothetical protein